MKKEYLQPDFKVVFFKEDVITTSGKDKEVDFIWDVDDLISFYD